MNNMYPYMNQPMQHVQPTMQSKQVVVVEPFVYGTVSTLVGKRAVIETSRGNLSGTVIDVKPDHLVLQERESTFFVRLMEVIWIMPE